MRWKVATIVLLLAILVMGVRWWQTNAALTAASEIIDKYAAAELERQHFVPGTFEKPKIPDAPLGTTPILTASGHTHHPPTPGAATVVEKPVMVPDAPSSVGPSGSPAPDVPRGNPCSLDDLDVDLGCDLAVLGTPSKPWGRLVTSATIKAWGQVLTIPPTPASEVTLSVTPAVQPPRWHGNLMFGAAVGERFGLEFGGQFAGKSRVGGYALAEWQPATGGSSYYDVSRESYVSTTDPATWRIHAGIAFRLK